MRSNKELTTPEFLIMNRMKRAAMAVQDGNLYDVEMQCHEILEIIFNQDRT